MFPANHQPYIKSLYKAILKEGSLFFDDRARFYIKDRVRKIFKDYKTCKDIDRVKYKIREGRKRLHRLEQANRGNQKSALKVLEEVYGRSGKTRHALLYPYLNAHQPRDLNIQPEPLVAHALRTTPPPLLCPPLRAIITKDLGKSLEPELPVPQYKPLHPGRKANLLWRHHSMLLERVSVPLPFEIICELEKKAGAPSQHPLTCATLLTGGPLWHTFYSALTNVVDMIPHLRPNAELPQQSQLIRQEPLSKSPYMTSKKPTLVEFIEPDQDQRQPIVQYTPRQKRRLYRRLLQDVPLINQITAYQLWDESVKYTVSKSQWVPKGVTFVLQDIPEEHVIESTLQSSSKKKKKSNK